jgi:hypothetical protein
MDKMKHLLSIGTPREWALDLIGALALFGAGYIAVFLAGVMG